MLRRLYAATAQGIADLPRHRIFAWIAAALLVVGWAASVDTDPRRLLFGCILGWTLLALGWIDWHTLRLPDALTLPLLVLGLVTGWMDSLEALYASVAGALVGYASLLAVGVCYRLARGREGLGRGDAKLLAACGAWLGIAALPWVVLVAAVFGLVLAILQGVRGHRLRRETALPFGPPLALAIWIIWLYGTPGG